MVEFLSAYNRFAIHAKYSSRKKLDVDCKAVAWKFSKEDSIFFKDDLRGII